MIYSDFHQEYLYIGQFVYDINKKKYGQIIRMDSKSDLDIFYIQVGYGSKLHYYKISDLDQLQICI
jgi:hypothetical protein